MAAAPERRHASAAEFEAALGRWRRQPRRRALAVVGGLSLLGLALAGAVYQGWSTAASSRTPDAASSPPAPAVVPPRILHLGVEHLARRSEAEYEPRGLLGETSFVVRPGDDVRLRADLSAPGYAFLIALRPDGIVEVCDPDDPAVSPAKTLHPQYPPPTKTGEVYRLEDGTGLQAFALVVSRNPLPSFDAWRRKVGAPPWKAGLTGPSGVVWRHDGRWPSPGVRRDPNGRRSKGKALRGGAEVAALGDWLEAIPGIDGVEVVAFPVLPPGP
jgi:hypothetical protein